MKVKKRHNTNTLDIYTADTTTAISLPADLYRLHPMEVIKGKIPDKDYFKQQIAEAKINRVIKNKAFNKCAFIR